MKVLLAVIVFFS